ncbi:uncharacterized protein IWZ02DRAFT_434577 [Phyllosticta citriasiana]|uniref:uncharacterized protein n=1 Tax=Phyllosticta citriasiana TaxID=595635 RepID=UPI0030FDB4D9
MQRLSPVFNHSASSPTLLLPPLSSSSSSSSSIMVLSSSDPFSTPCFRCNVTVDWLRILDVGFEKLPQLVMVRRINHILAISRVLVANVDEDLQIAHDPLALPLRESLPLSVELIVNVKLQLFFLLFQVSIAWVGHCPGVGFEAWVVSHLIVKVESDFDLLVLAAGRTVCQVKVHENILFNGVDDGTGGSRRDSVRLEGAGKAGHSNVGDCKMKKRSPGGATDDLANGDSDEDAEALTWGVLVKNGLSSLEATVELEHDVCRRWDFGS